MPAHAVAAAPTRGDDIHDYLHDVRDTAPTFSSPGHGARMVEVLRRSTTSTSDIVHDKFFIPGVVASGVILAVVLLCVVLLLRKKAKPPGVQWATPQTMLAQGCDLIVLPVFIPDMRQQPRGSLSNGHNLNSLAPGSPGSPNGSRRLSNIQRKPLAALPNGAENGTPPPEGPPYDVNGPYGAPVAYNNTTPHLQNQPGSLYYPPPHSQDHQAQYQNQNQYPQYDAEQHSYQPQNPGSVNMSVTPADVAAGGQWQQSPQYSQNYPGAAPTRVSILSTDQSVTQVGSDKDYYPAGGYGKMGTQPQKHLDGSHGSPGHDEEEYFDPYGGIERGNTAGSRNQVRR
ncbi:hypothetical protein D9619_000072 [Psilocybe cf. subviscida]|uniref:Uncharacterized protein n=1 Tax=Psilocybe cf. subviscida TaxID=2480587 RepID=A0A8H5BFS6_9AGAR|nr:hypothetical protein D9619_000072 [Psilocybe cf. subviscida]